MTNTAYCGLLALSTCLLALVSWLQWRRATATERLLKRWQFSTNLILSFSFIVVFAISFVRPKSAPPTSWEMIGVPLLFLFLLWTVTRELRIAFRARNAADQRSPADGNDITRENA
jgi:cytochrome bd-type quinol oxidase subunit 2